MLKKIVLATALSVLFLSTNSRALLNDSFTSNTLANYVITDPWGAAPATDQTFTIDTVEGAAKFKYLKKTGLYDYKPKIVMHGTETLESGEAVRVHIDVGTEQNAPIYRMVSLVISDLQVFYGWSAYDTGADFIGYQMIRSPSGYLEVNRANGLRHGWTKITNSTEYFGPTDYWMEIKRGDTEFIFSTSVDNGATWQVFYTDSNPTGADYSTVKYVGFASEIPGYAWDSGIYSFLTPPITVAIKDFDVVATAPTNCSSAIAAGYGLKSDLNHDCYVNLKDFALVAQSWMECIDPQSAQCENPWQ